MSIGLMAAVWSTDLPSSEKMVLLALADNSNDEGVCWPSIRTICRKTSLTERTVQKCILKLSDKNLLSVQGRHGHSNVFSIHLTTYLAGTMEPPQGRILIHTPVRRAPPPPQSGRGTPANGTGRIIKESSFEPSEIFQTLLKTSGKEPPRTERIQKAIDKVGGWVKIRNVTDYDLPDAERAFAKAYAET
jgi:Helix-turn-helix domain